MKRGLAALPCVLGLHRLEPIAISDDGTRAVCRCTRSVRCRGRRFHVTRTAHQKERSR